MSTLTLPRIAAELNGSPFYAMHSLVNDNVVWTHRPALLDPGFRWATADEVTTEHVDLTVEALADLLFVSQLDLDHADDEQILAAVDRRLTMCHCHLDRCVEQLAQAYGEHPETAQPRMAACLAVAAALIGGKR